MGDIKRKTVSHRFKEKYIKHDELIIHAEVELLCEIIEIETELPLIQREIIIYNESMSDDDKDTADELEQYLNLKRQRLKEIELDFLS